MTLETHIKEVFALALADAAFPKPPNIPPSIKAILDGYGPTSADVDSMANRLAVADETSFPSRNLGRPIHEKYRELAFAALTHLPHLPSVKRGCSSYSFWLGVSDE